MDADAIAAAIAAAMQPVLQQLQQQQQPQPQPQAQPNQPAQFARSPALVHDTVIDYSTSTGAKLYSKVTSALPTTFSLSKPNIRVLLNELETRANEYGWATVLSVNVGDQANPVLRNLITDHGRITLDAVNAHSMTYIAQQNRQAQNNYQLYLCLTKSLDEETKKRMANEHHRYTITAGNQAFQCGASYLKLLLSKAEVDTRATASHIRRNLAHLSTYMKETAQFDVTVFNEYVRDNISTLTSRGETSDDLMTNLFLGYLACSDKKFVEYIERIKDGYDEGSDLTPEALMTKAEVKYAQRKKLERNWNNPSKEHEEIVALKAKLEAAVASMKQRRGKPFQKEGGKGGGKVGGKQQKKKGMHSGKMAFRNTKPKAGESHTKNVDGDIWHYCPHHGFWGRHKASECRKNKKGDEASEITASLAQVGIQDLGEESE